MSYKLKKIFFKITIIIIMVTILFPSLNYQYGQVFGFHDESDYDRFGGGPHTYRAPDAGDAVKVPQEFEQSMDDVELYDHIVWGGKQLQLYNKWSSEGKKASDSHWAYLEIGGKPRYMVALAPIYGVTGDYVDIYVTHNGQESIYPCIIVDTKDIWVDAAFEYNGKIYGHQGSGGRCKIVEVCTEASSVSPLSPWLNKLKNVTQIANGGSIFEHPDGPVGLDGNYTYEDGTTSGSSDGSSSEAGTFIGAVGSFLRTGWATLNSFLDNHVEKREDVTVLYDFKNMSSSYGTMGNGDIISACEAVTKMLIDRGCTYSQENLIWNDINRQFNTNTYFCCATYVASVLYYAGLLTEEQINAYNYNYTGDGGIPDMLAAAGWHQVSPSQAQPGDVVVKYTVHAMIYAGNGEIWDESTCVTSTSGRPPLGSPYQYDISNCQVWRR